MAVFHFTFVLASQRSGGSPLGLMPLASGPRHWCQLFRRRSRPSSARMLAPVQATANVSRMIRVIRRSPRVSEIATGCSPRPCNHIVVSRDFLDLARGVDAHGDAG